MSEAWEILAASGVPAGAIRAAPDRTLEGARLRTALDEVTRRPEALTEREADPLLAWLRGFRQHWPVRFDQILGVAGSSALAALETRRSDPNRYLKLRRIAIENLSRVL